MARIGTGTARSPRTIRLMGLVAVMLLTACGGGAAEDGDVGEAGETPASEDGGESEVTAEAGGPSGTLAYGYDWGISSFDPHRATRSQDNPWLFPTYDRLVHQLPSGEPSGGLAESWEWSEDGTALEFVLREGVTFHDGEPFDAEAVRANIERGQAEGSTVASELAVIESVAVVDDHTVRLDLAQPSASLLLILSERPGMMVSPAAFDNDDLDRAPVGAGMFRVSDYRDGSHAIYEPYEGYWDPSAIGVERLEIHEMADASTRRSAIQSGQINWTKIAASDVPVFQGHADLDVELFQTLSYLNLPMNRSREFFADERVRQAMNFAIDREAILETIFGGLGQLEVQPYPTGYFAHNPDYPAEHYAYDPDRARELLEEAGYGDGFTFENLVPAQGDSPRIAEAIQAQLADVGITMQISTHDPTQSGDLWGVQRVGDTFQGTWGGRPDPSQTLFVQYHPDGFFNTGAHVDERIVESYNQTLSALDPDEREAALQAASGRVAEAALDIVLLFPHVPNVIHQEIQGAEAYLSGQQDFRGVRVRSDQ